MGNGQNKTKQTDPGPSSYRGTPHTYEFYLEEGLTVNIREKSPNVFLQEEGTSNHLKYTGEFFLNSLPSELNLLG